MLPLVGPPWGRTLPRQLAASKRFLEVTAGFLEVKLASWSLITGYASPVPTIAHLQCAAHTGWAPPGTHIIKATRR